MCGKSLLVDEDTRYIADLTVFAAYDVMEMTSEDLARRDIKAEIRRTLERLQGRDQKEIEEEIFAQRRFDLCPSCRKRFLDDPFGKRETCG
jgi:transcription initiation factor IIE alpha subunit